MGTLPDYDSQLSGFHEAVEAELQGLIEGLPLRQSWWIRARPSTCSRCRTSP